MPARERQGAIKFVCKKRVSLAVAGWCGCKRVSISPQLALQHRSDARSHEDLQTIAATQFNQRLLGLMCFISCVHSQVGGTGVMQRYRASGSKRVLECLWVARPTVL